MRHFKSAGFCYAPGDLITEEDFWDYSRLRLGKVKVSEGTLLPFNSEDPNLEIKAKNVEARLRQPGLSSVICAYLKPTPVVDEIPVEVKKEAPIAAKPQNASVKPTHPGTPKAPKREAMDVAVAAPKPVTPKVAAKPQN